MRTCEHCGKAFTPSKYKKRVQRFCSEPCGRQWWKEHSDQRKKYTFVCKYCGQEYQVHDKNRNQFCCREHAFAYKTARSEQRKRDKELGIGASCKIFIGTCVECGKPFVHRRRRTICSRECKLARGRRLWGEHKEAIGRKQGRIQRIACQHCGREFEQVVYNKVKIYCSRKCARAAWRVANPEKATLMKAIERRRRRAMKMATLHVDIDPWAVYERDGWRCGICGRKVRRGLSFPHPMSASLDHIVPLASGGSHTWDNVQCAHFICNSRKGASEGGQLLLPVLSELT